MERHDCLAIDVDVVPSVQSPNERFVKHSLTEQFIQILRHVKPGALISFERLSWATHRDLFNDKQAKDLLMNAREIVERDYQISFRPEIGRGLVRIPQNEIPKYANNKHATRFKNDTKRYARTIKCVDYHALDDEAKAEFGKAMSAIGIRSVMIQPQFEENPRRNKGMDPTKHIDKTALLEQMKVMG